MKTLIIYMSYHHQNTEKIAKVMGEELEADLVPANQARADALATYGLVGFGSGIYYRKFHKTIITFAEALPVVADKQAFVFSTSGSGGTKQHTAFKELLESRGFTIVGEFSCKGWDTVGPFRLIGGVNKGRPNEEDLEHARVFAHGLKEGSA
jgi:flavodoxin